MSLVSWQGTESLKHKSPLVFFYLWVWFLIVGSILLFSPECVSWLLIWNYDDRPTTPNTWLMLLLRKISSDFRTREDESKMKVDGFATNQCYTWSYLDPRLCAWHHPQEFCSHTRNSDFLQTPRAGCAGPVLGPGYNQCAELQSSQSPKLRRQQHYTPPH